MSLIQVTDLKIYIGTNGKYQSNLHLEAGKDNIVFYLMLLLRWRWAKKREEKPCTDLSKNFKAWASE